MASATRIRVPSAQPPEAHEGRGMGSNSNTASKAGKQVGLLSFDEMPEWFQRESNQWIHHGYRPISGSAHASFCSWSYMHNESVNIYSHLIPAVLFLLGQWHLQQYLASRYPGVTGADFIAFSIFMLTAVTCLSLSATYHTLMNHSRDMEHFCLQLDMLGVVIFILGDLVLGIYMVFWCEPWPRNTYWSMIGVFGTLTIFMTLHPKFQGRKYRLFRALMFVATGLAGVAPLVH
ncbi:hemolysin-III related-domain-containing protein [Astrocystis sublimbata]|nr:hemolysin-III related-domain-containing protein [Astrocystis sublimbata]